MSHSSNYFGRAYEYASIMQLKLKLQDLTNVQIVENSSLLASKKGWDKISKKMQDEFITSTKASVQPLLEVEPLILEDSKDIITLQIQSDAQGKLGDVRDIVIKREGINWEIGLSVKHNHFAVKHSRLAKSLDFGEKWFEVPCSPQYWEDVKPIFNYLSAEKSMEKCWSDLPSKENDVYIPLLTAFLSEIRRSYEANQDLPQRMVEYLLGKYDFYKVISVKSKYVTQIQPFNLRGTLNKTGKGKKPKIVVPVSSLPKRIVSSGFKPNSTNTVEIYFDEGWQFGFRIHNASTKVKTSLKFDIQIIGMPASIMILECKWKSIP